MSLSVRGPKRLVCAQVTLAMWREEIEVVRVTSSVARLLVPTPCRLDCFALSRRLRLDAIVTRRGSIIATTRAKKDQSAITKPASVPRKHDMRFRSCCHLALQELSLVCPLCGTICHLGGEAVPFKASLSALDGVDICWPFKRSRGAEEERVLKGFLGHPDN